MKISVLGYSGSGKSTTAKLLGEHYGIPVLFMDRIHWLPGWQTRPMEERLSMTEAFLNEHSDWVIDGNYWRLSFERRLEESDRIVIIAFSPFACLWRVWKRYRVNKGKTRESMTEGCDEKLDLEFVYWVLLEGRSKKYRQRLAKVQADFPEKTVVIKNQRALDDFLKKEGISQ